MSGASVINVKYDSNLLYYRDEFNVIVPSEGKLDKMKVLYLLHGLHGTCHDWITYTNITRLSETYKVAVICPNAKNSFYTDMVYGEPFYTQLTTEFLQHVRRIFGFSDKRQDNMIAGLSMGGYGAFKIAFNNPDMFSIAASFSGALNINDLSRFKTNDEKIDKINKSLFINILGENPVIVGTDNDLLSLVQRNKTVNGYSIKDIQLYQYCGTSDNLYGHNIEFKDAAEKASMKLKFVTDGGGHEWERWNEQVALFLKEYVK